MPFIKIWLHTVWTTKNRIPYLNKKIRLGVFDHIMAYARKNNIYIDFINGYFDHVHCLISINSDQSIASIMNKIKGESSHWINSNNLLEEKFAWQQGYYAASIGTSQINIVRKHIKYQDVHHKSQLLDEEIKIMINEYGLEEY